MSDLPDSDSASHPPQGGSGAGGSGDGGAREEVQASPPAAPDPDPSSGLPEGLDDPDAELLRYLFGVC